MKVNIISINPITVIPLLRYIVDFFIKDTKARVTITETHVKNFNNYYDNIDQCNFDNISEYETYEAFSNQSTGFKFNKYFIIIKKILSIYIKSEQQLIYTSDYQVLFFSLVLRAFFKSKKVIIIYHQYELVELKKLNKINHFFYAYVLKKAKNIDLTLFSEINRLNYFAKESSLRIENSMVLPNSCKKSTQTNNTKHHLFDQFPEGSFIVAHIGNVGGHQHYFHNFISAVEKLEANQNVIFVFIGRKNELIEDTIKSKQLSNLYFIDPVPHEELDQIYPFIDLGIILYKGTSPNYEYCAPNKLYELWKYGVPVIGHQLKGLTPLFDNKVKGVLTNFDNPLKISTAIINYLEEKENKEELKGFFNTELSIDIHLKEFSKKLMPLLN